jgi:Asp/Glu/hydantoin racemase
LEIQAGEIADRLSDQLNDLCDLCAAERVDSLLLGGGPLAGLAPRIATRCSVPVIDGTQAAIEQLCAWLDRGTIAPANG